MFKVMDRVRTVQGREDALWYPDAATMLFAYAMGTPTSIKAGLDGTVVGTTVQDDHRQVLVQFGAAEDGCVLLDEADIRHWSART